MIERIHAIRTKDESIWINFDGSVPKPGDFVDVSLLAKDYELTEDQKNKKWLVYKVDWFLAKWRKEAYPSTNEETAIISQARVFIK